MNDKTRTAIIVPSSRPTALTREPRLVILQGQDIGRQVELGQKPTLIGRGEDVDLRINGEGVSRQHASVMKIGNTHHVSDLGSTNGTIVNGQRLTRSHALREGDLIKIGKVVLRYTENPIEAAYHAQIVEQARVDQLTRAFNKAHFQEELERTVETAPSGLPVSLVLFDIDHFKRINDTYGHPAGDAVLSNVAGTARSVLYPDAFFARVGGEEFAVLMRGVDRSGAMALAEHVRTTIARTVFEHEDVIIPVTVSLGVADLAPGEAGSDLYRRADERLYEAKRSGRNRVC